MENRKSKQIEEEIRQYKLYKIQVAEAKIREYEQIFNEIKENIVIKFTKNVSSSFLRIILFVIILLLLFLSIFFLFPEQAIKIMEENGELLSEVDKEEILLSFPYFGYLLVFLSALLSVISILLKKNIQKRNTIYRLSKLIKEVIEYMHENVEEEKKKYEYFVDSIADIKNKENDNDLNL